VVIHIQNGPTLLVENGPTLVQTFT